MRDGPLIILFFSVDIFSRGLLWAVIPLDLLAYFGNAQHVTFFYAAVSMFGLGNSLLVPRGLRLVGTRTAMVGAGFLMALSTIFLANGNIFYIAAGLVIRTLAGSCVDIAMISHIMDCVPRHRLSTFEPLRLFFQGACVTIAPWLGYYLQVRIGGEAPYALVALAGVFTMGIAWHGMPPRQSNAVNVALPSPAATIIRFYRQPRLRLAWILSLVRGSFWTLYTIYAPIFSVQCGWSPSSGAAVLSLGLTSLFLVPVWGRVVRTFGIRQFLTVTYTLSGVALFATALAGFWMPYIAPVGLVATAFAASMLDGSGHVLFLRATRSYERPAMAGIYITYRDVSQVAPVTMFSAILTVATLPTAFATFALLFVSSARLSRFIHPRLR